LKNFEKKIVLMIWVDLPVEEFFRVGGAPGIGNAK
jgi:hypothetical protein